MTAPWYEEFGFGPNARFLPAPDGVTLAFMRLALELEAQGLVVEDDGSALVVREVGLEGRFWLNPRVGNRYVLRVLDPSTDDAHTYTRDTVAELVELWLKAVTP